MQFFSIQLPTPFLFQFFAKTAYNPASNQPAYPDGPFDRRSAQQIISQRIAERAPQLQVDAVSWRSLQHPYPDHRALGPSRHQAQRSADDLLYAEPGQIYAEIRPHGADRECRAAPQVPLYRKMGRRSSDGDTVTGDAEERAMKAAYKGFLPEVPQTADMPGLSYPGANYRLSLDGGRRESTGSLSSSLADGSKDSLASFGSNSTLTGQEKEDYIMSRFRRTVQQKEEFLRMPAAGGGGQEVREFYGRPRKLERQVWPPAHQAAAARVKDDVEVERGLNARVEKGGGESGVCDSAGAVNGAADEKR